MKLTLLNARFANNATSGAVAVVIEFTVAAECAIDVRYDKFAEELRSAGGLYEDEYIRVTSCVSPAFNAHYEGLSKCRWFLPGSQTRSFPTFDRVGHDVVGQAPLYCNGVFSFIRAAKQSWQRPMRR